MKGAAESGWRGASTVNDAAPFVGLTSTINPSNLVGVSWIMDSAGNSPR
jgi:hypothetical protein